jgi:hypothetical protein
LRMYNPDTTLRRTRLRSPLSAISSSCQMHDDL